jgi:hypothetical protein
MCHGNLDAIVASHQDTILGSAQFGDAYRQPDADRQQSDRECDGRDIRQHPLPVIVDIVADLLVARQVVGDFKLRRKGSAISALREGRSRARSKLEHDVLVVWRGGCDGALGSHRCQSGMTLLFLARLRCFPK